MTTVIFDKTGTLTQGRMVVSDVRLFGEGLGLGEDHVLACAAAVEASSEHPIAGAVLDYAAARLDPEFVSYSRGGDGVGEAAVARQKRILHWLWPVSDMENDHGIP